MYDIENEKHVKGAGNQQRLQLKPLVYGNLLLKFDANMPCEPPLPVVDWQFCYLRWLPTPVKVFQAIWWNLAL